MFKMINSLGIKFSDISHRVHREHRVFLIFADIELITCFFSVTCVFFVAKNVNKLNLQTN